MRWPVRLGALALIIAAVLGYGYWRAWSRANITMIVSDVSRGSNSVPAFVAELTLRDSAGTSLAEGRSSARFGSVSFIHPQHGSCEEEEQSAIASAEGRTQWDRCIGEKFRWQAGWVQQVRALLKSGSRNVGSLTFRSCCGKGARTGGCGGCPYRMSGAIP
jgi:hypothetical protein